MKKTVHTLVGASLIVLLAGWGSPESNVAGEKKQAVNFSGTIETKSGQLLAVDNISIDNLYKQIPLYLKPDTAKPTVAASGIDCSKCCPDKTITPSPYKEFMLESDPFSTLITTKADLAELSEIIVPHPDEIWTYQKDKQHSKLEFIEIVLVSGDKKKTKTSYLIEKRKRVYADRINEAGPTEETIPFEAIKSLKIDGWVDRKTHETKARKAHAAQQPAPVTAPILDVQQKPTPAPAPAEESAPDIQPLEAPATQPVEQTDIVPAPENLPLTQIEQELELAPAQTPEPVQEKQPLAIPAVQEPEIIPVPAISPEEQVEIPAAVEPLPTTPIVPAP